MLNIPENEPTDRAKVSQSYMFYIQQFECLYLYAFHSVLRLFDKLLLFPWRYNLTTVNSMYLTNFRIKHHKDPPLKKFLQSKFNYWSMNFIGDP